MDPQAAQALNASISDLIGHVGNDPAMADHAWVAFSVLMEVDPGPPAAMEVKGYMYGDEDTWGALPIDFSQVEQHCAAIYTLYRNVADGAAWKKCLVQFHRPKLVGCKYELNDDARWTITPDDPSALPNELRPVAPQQSS